MDDLTDPMQEQRVWSRVMAAQASAPTACERTARRDAPVFDETAAQELYTAQRRAAATYRALAAEYGRGARQTLLHLAEEKCREARRLAAVYFVMTGERPRADCLRVPCAPQPEQALRRAYQEELCAAELYRRYAERADTHACLLAQMARRAECAAGSLLGVLGRCL